MENTTGLSPNLLIEALQPNPEHEYILAGHEAAAYNQQVYDLGYVQLSYQTGFHAGS